VYRRGVVARTSSLRSAVAGWLEAGVLSSVWPDALARAQAGFAARALARPLAIPRGAVVVTVGGATLGGSGKTRVALAVSRALAGRGARVVLIGHAYRARPARARVVEPHDALTDVGDEALLCARALGGAARVVVAPSRQAAVDFAASLVPRADVLVIDGPLQLAPVRASLALLAVDAHAPWGADALPPAGDLRAPRAALLAHADLVVPVDATPLGATLGGERVELSALAVRSGRGTPRLGLFMALSRPARLEQALRRAGLDLPVVVRAPDHGPVTPALAARLRAAEVDLWLATEKCGLHLAPAVGDRAIAFLDGTCALPDAASAALADVQRTLVGGSHTRGALTPRSLKP
jgi:tetraacyldisaccharide 4'-kinase